MGIVPQFLEGAAYGVLNDILSGYHTDALFMSLKVYVTTLQS